MTEKLLLKKQKSLSSYLKNGGYEALKKALSSGQKAVLEEISKSKLRGRGGAAFWASLKWETVAAQMTSPKYVICNSDEGEPATFKDRYLWENNPYQVIEGITIAGYTVGAKKGFIYIRGEYRDIALRIEKMLAELRKKGYLGENILGSEFSFDIEVVMGSGAYVCGESSAILNSIEGKRGEPRIKPPRTSVVGLFGKPTLVNNVETLSNVPLIVKNGGDWYASLGVGNSTGPKLFSVSGFVKKPGVYEFELGKITLGELIEAAGGVEGEFKGAMIGGGAAGFIVNEEFLDMPMDFDSAWDRGISLGTGDVIVLNKSVNLWKMLHNIAWFFEHESCGKCMPCRYGTHHARKIIEKILAGNGNEEDIEKLNRIARTVKIASICGLGKSSMDAYLSAMKHFREELMGVIS